MKAHSNLVVFHEAATMWVKQEKDYGNIEEIDDIEVNLKYPILMESYAEKKAAMAKRAEEVARLRKILAEHLAKKLADEDAALAKKKADEAAALAKKKAD